MTLDYLVDLKKDLVTQFQDQPNIDILVEAVQKQLQDVCVFYEQLRDLRSVYTAYGQQLDGVGQIAVLSRADAGELANYKKSTYVLTDDEYRNYLIFKIWKNTNKCTYEDIQTAFRMFWDKPLYYSEYPNQPLGISEPATMVFESSVCKPEDHVEKLFDLPFIKAAGVAVIIIAYTEAEEMQYTLSANSYLGRGYMETYLPGAMVNPIAIWTEQDGIETELHIEWDQMTDYGGRNEDIHIDSSKMSDQGGDDEDIDITTDYSDANNRENILITSTNVNVNTQNGVVYINFPNGQ